jgi:hypothetical protein
VKTVAGRARRMARIRIRLLHVLSRAVLVRYVGVFVTEKLVFEMDRLH